VIFVQFELVVMKIGRN